MLFGEELDDRLIKLPDYTPEICSAEAGTRLLYLNRLSEIYIPSQMTREIYSKLYLAMIRSLEKKGTRPSLQQGIQNHKRITGKAGHSILGGSDSFSIIGKSGIGKSTAITKSLDLAGGNDIITLDKPYGKIIPCVNIQCPHDCSVKGMLLSILGAVDAEIGTRYHERAIRYRMTIDSLIGTVAQVANNHILLVVVDECQNIVRNKHGVNVVSSLTQLINSSGISICLVGLPETEAVFRDEMQLARRSVGLTYREMDCDETFISFCRQVFRYQYVAKPVTLTEELTETLYQCSGGIVGIVLSLLMEAQQIAILSGREEITRELLLETFRTRLRNVQDFVEIQPKKLPQTSVKDRRKTVQRNTNEVRGREPADGLPTEENLIKKAVRQISASKEDPVTVLRRANISITEVGI